MSPNSPSRLASPPTLVTGSAPPGAATIVTGVHPVDVSTFRSELPTRAEPRTDDLPELRPALVGGDLGSCGGLRVVRVLGRGGMGAVYEAIDPALSRRVALKLMLPELAESESGRERFLREARTAAAVRHENVVSVYAVGEDAGVPYLTMELLRGDHLGNVIGRGPALADVVRIGREVACGLAAAHALGVIHRDVKPANIWIEEPSGRVRLLDFGLARFGGELSAVVRNERPGAPDLTAVGGVVGTPIYMAPEQVRGEPVDARTDLFGLGVVLYQMVTGRLPFRGNRLFGIAAAICAGAYVPVPELAPETPPGLVELIHRLLAPDPDARPPSADAVADELLAIGTHLLVSSGSVSVAIPVRTPAAPPFNFDSDFDFDSDSALSAPRRVETPSKLLLGSAALLLLVVGAAFGFAKRPAPAPAPQVAAPQSPALRPGPPSCTPLFNGRDLSGWHAPQGGLADAWTVRDGAISGRTKDTDQVLLSDKEFANFELRMEYRWPKSGGHTVILLRAADTSDLVNDGMSLNIGDDEGFLAVHGRTIGGLYRTGLIQGVTFEPTAANRTIGSWNEIQVVARRQTIEVKLNGVRMPTADLAGKYAADAQRPGLNRSAGMIGLVCHWGPIEFRNITVRPIPE